MNWSILRGDELSHEVWSNNNECVAEVFTGEKDARLVAAAPVLYACVKGLLELLMDADSVSGSDVVSWLSEQVPYWKDALDACEVDLNARIDEYIKGWKETHPQGDLSREEVARILFDMECG